MKSIKKKKEINVSAFCINICVKKNVKIYSITNSTLIPETNANEVGRVRQNNQGNEIF